MNADENPGIRRQVPVKTGMDADLSAVPDTAQAGGRR